MSNNWRIFCVETDGLCKEEGETGQEKPQEETQHPLKKTLGLWP